VVLGETCGRPRWLGQEPGHNNEEPGHNNEETGHSAIARSGGYLLASSHSITSLTTCAFSGSWNRSW